MEKTCFGVDLLDDITVNCVPNEWDSNQCPGNRRVVEQYHCAAFEVKK